MQRIVHFLVTNHVGYVANALMRGVFAVLAAVLAWERGLWFAFAGPGGEL